MHSYFFNCDWGTSSFRLRLVKAPSGVILAERTTSEGAASLAATTSAEDRPERFQSVLRRHVDALSQSVAVDATHAPIVISGMASSSIGWKDLPYAETPFSLDGCELGLHRIDDVRPLTQPVYLVSGVRSERDVMRGEETELLGLRALHDQLFPDGGSTWVLLPGTHSKHVFVRDRRVVDFRTFMTGELFQLLRRQSSLKHPSAREEPMHPGAGEQGIDAFREGVRLSEEGGLTNALFQVRVSQLLRNASLIASEALLSGLLIGHELWSLARELDPRARIVLCAPDKLNAPYRNALEAVGLARRTTEIAQDDAARLSALGQWQILSMQQRNLGQWRTPTRTPSSASVNGISDPSVH